ncbi:hypothetical protein KI387_026900, partial [Taxus chinensis]
AWGRKNEENRLSPGPGGPWDSWDVKARIGRKAARRSTQQRDIRAVGTRGMRKGEPAE